MAYLSWLLMWFEVISSLRINLDKNEIFSVGRVENLKVLALEVGCKVGRLPTSYLGLHLEAWLVELWDLSGEEGVWSPKFSRPFNDWRWRSGEITIDNLRKEAQSSFGR
ncbi:hypothetical protein CK203_005912 [Vitis vinifera]|uniref:Uncharacterized protein n=1 Tax=Vitis vinifera TaxID=29760 RepID=A0A438K5H1_VITVI|nr:hypothetical protein CK203_005912 [Vitis vinifera]